VGTAHRRGKTCQFDTPSRVVVKCDGAHFIVRGRTWPMGSSIVSLLLFGGPQIGRKTRKPSPSVLLTVVGPQMLRLLGPKPFSHVDAKIRLEPLALSVIFFWAPSKSIAPIQTMRWRSSSEGSRLERDCSSQRQSRPELITSTPIWITRKARSPMRAPADVRDTDGQSPRRSPGRHPGLHPPDAELLRLACRTIRRQSAAPAPAPAVAGLC
jgi:hypothetical protein